MSRKRCVASAIALALCVCTVALAGCGTAAPREVSIGYIGGLSGRNAGLGVAGRDAVQLAVDERNAAGGVDGREVRLVTRDDRQDATAAVAAVGSLADAGVAAIVGPMTSAMGVAAAPEADRRRVLLLSPTVSTDDLTGIDDHFLRVYPDNRSAASEMAVVITDRLRARRVTAVYDAGNRAHSQSWIGHLATALAKRGAAIETSLTFTSGTGQDFRGLAERVAASKADCVFVVANAADTALLCQHLRRLDADVPVTASEWSSTEDVLGYGGRAVEGMLFLDTVDRTDSSASYRAFHRAFLARFGYEPGFASVHAYDAARVILDAMEQTDDGSSLRDAILKQGSWPGVQGSSVFDRSGDAQPDYHLMTIRAGRFVRAP